LCRASRNREITEKGRRPIKERGNFHGNGCPGKKGGKRIEPTERVDKMSRAREEKIRKGHPRF